MGKRQWIFQDEKNDQLITDKIDEETGGGRLLSGVLQARGIKSGAEAKAFLSPDDEEYDPYLLPDIALFLNRVKRARGADEKICVYGDYDADGITATAIMMNALLKFGIKNITKYLPDRENDGYGLNKAAIDFLYSENVSLIITVDCGISSVEEVIYAKSLGIDVLVTDHHNCPEVLPDAVAVINPKKASSSYPYRDLAGAGVAYKIAEALIPGETEFFLPFAAIGTVADVVALKGENRTIVKKGLEALNAAPGLGIAALYAAAGKSGDITGVDIAFIIAPRINSSGRMDRADIAYDLLTTDDKEKAEVLASKLCELNDARRSEEQRIYKEAVEKIKEESLADDEVIVVGGEGWNAGVIGIVAARITEAAYKPCAVITYDGEIGKASARSIEGFNLFDALESAKDSLSKFGGHALAAGFSLEKEKEGALRRALNRYAAENLKESDKIRYVKIDLRLSPEDITVQNIEKLTLLEPTGAENPKPVFALIDCKITDMRTMSEGKHLKLFVEKDGYTLEAVRFNIGQAAKKLYTGKRVHLAGSLEVNSFNGRPQMILSDILY